LAWLGAGVRKPTGEEAAVSLRGDDLGERNYGDIAKSPYVAGVACGR
jgi:hypothetical protein